MKHSSASFKNEYYLFGGRAKFTDHEHAEFSKMSWNGRRLEKIGTLDFVFVNGGCSNVNDKLVIG